MSTELLETAATTLGPLLEEVVFLGGASIHIWLSDPGTPPARATDDVDVISAITTRTDYYRLGERLRARGFGEASEKMEPHWNLKTPLRSRKSAPQCGFSDIGAPGFEPGTSPTRTARATRLRHAPTHRAVSHTAIVARVPTQVAEIIAELDTLLQPTRFQDYCPNGLQVPGPEQVATLATGVSASAELFQLAANEHAGMLLVHHGLFWGSGPTAPIDQQLKHRLKLLFDADIALAAYHLPLDAHPTLGNNALLAGALGAQRLDDLPFARHHGELIGCLARFPGEGLPAAELFARVHSLTEREPLVFDSGPSQIRTLAIVSGAGSDYLTDATSAGADALLTGEPAERAMAQARELGLHLIAAGHYATETFGVRALGEHLAERFGVRHVFLDVPNPV